jgi:8-oxo-dGTP pyrophosphatase MutT (NUDIX family)
VLKAWYAQGIFSGWRNERYAVSTTFDAEPILSIERSGAPLFGTQMYGVHINGITRRDGRLFMWVARRSRSKPEYPGRLDHLVAGGLATGMTAYGTAVKECAEEANVPETLARQVRAVGTVSYRRFREHRSARIVLFCYDLELPESFVPANTDGEVAEFYLWPVERVIDHLVRTHEFKTNCNLVIIDFLIRHGYLCPEDAHYIEIVQRLRSVS